MPMNTIFATRRASVLSRSLVVLSLTLAMMVAGCKKKSAVPPDDAALNTQVQSKLASDQNLSGQSIQSSVASGVATLSGSVSSDAARTAATVDAAQVAGIKTVIDNLAVQAPSVAATAVPPAPMTTQNYAPVASAKAQRPAPYVAAAPQPAAPVVHNMPAPMPAPAPAVVRNTPPPPPAPVVHNVTVPAGTSIPVTITQTLSSATSRPGDRFSGVISNDVIVNGTVVLAQGTPVTGHVDEAQDAAHFKGSSLLTISLSAIDRRGTHIEVSTEAFTKKGEGRGKNTAEKIGGGAAVGAILGGIFGGGKGAGIGAAAGGGLGAGANGVTRGQQVEIPSETVVRFRLADPISVRVTTGN